jgi:hypothetical protein
MIRHLAELCKVGRLLNLPDGRVRLYRCCTDVFRVLLGNLSFFIICKLQILNSLLESWFESMPGKLALVPVGAEGWQGFHVTPGVSSGMEAVATDKEY